jgi:hypothetical protein
VRFAGPGKSARQGRQEVKAESRRAHSKSPNDLLAWNASPIETDTSHADTPRHVTIHDAIATTARILREKSATSRWQSPVGAFVHRRHEVAQMCKRAKSKECTLDTARMQKSLKFFGKLGRLAGYYAGHCVGRNLAQLSVSENSGSSCSGSPIVSASSRQATRQRICRLRWALACGSRCPSSSCVSA